MACCLEGQAPPPLAPGTPATPAPQTTETRPSSLYGPWSAEIFYWLTSTSPALRGGAAATGFENLNYPGNGKYTPGVSLSFPVSKTGMLNFSGFITKGSTSTTAAQALTLFGTRYASGDLVTANYTVRNLKLSLQDLFFPFPRKEGQRWRVKTLWEVQYASIITNPNAPLAPTTDSSGNAV